MAQKKSDDATKTVNIKPGDEKSVCDWSLSLVILCE